MSSRDMESIWNDTGELASDLFAASSIPLLFQMFMSHVPFDVSGGATAVVA